IEVKIYQQKLQASQADLDAAGARFLPDLEIGVGYLRHDGRLQETRGEVFDVSRSSLGAGPLVRLHADPAEAFFERLAAREAATAAAHGEARVRAETMVNAGLLYLGLLEGRALLEVARETVAHSREHAELTERAVELQAELRVNLARAQAALARDEQQLLAAQTNLRRASVDLAVLLRLSPTVFLLPTEETIQPMTLVDPETPLASLVDRALGSRPDLREVEALSRAADEHLSAEELSPWFPEIDLFVVYGRYGGGRGSDFQDFGDRLDAGATLSWTLEGLGLGVGARRRRARAEAREAALEVEGLRERVVGQVIRSWEQVRSLRARIGAADSEVRAASTALELVRDRLASGDAIQLEILEAIQEVAASRAALVNAIVEYGKAQHVLYYQVHGAAWER
ncbi:MAG: TolC family protein, partial [Planctomycetota bacterium]|nr:TolC family protein [Planctomycetota bacterium]